MGFIFILPLAALAAWSIFSIYRWLRRGGYETKWWRAFASLSAIGLAVGIWLAFFFHYTVAKISMQGFPIPVVVVTHSQTDGALVTSNMPFTIEWSGRITDILSGIALCLAPIAIAAFVRENRGKLMPEGKP
ncbi:MAG TPA: hypothetical protein VH413_00765 [Verrucomicrobiae bacterium]|jgi:hypothetical protein|nr:hypothetical protein [Verrucomicrobiae bacterium]